MQAIVTTFHGPTDTRDPRITARADAGRITVVWDDRLGVEDNHRAAALALIARLGWTPEWYGDPVTGSLPGAGYVHVLPGRVAASVS